MSLVDASAAPQGPGGKGAALVPEGTEKGNPAISLTGSFTLIGARHSAAVRLTSPQVSRSHAALMQGKDLLYVRDLASRTGVSVNQRVVREAQLADNDVLQIGPFIFRIRCAIDDALQRAPGTIAAGLQMGTADPVQIVGRSLLIGSRPNSDFPLNDPDVSSTHALIFEMDGCHYLRDLASRTGSYVNEKRVKQHRLRPGDVIRIGRAELRYVPTDAAASGITSAAPPMPMRSQPRVATVTLAPVVATYGDQTAGVTVRVEAEGRPVSGGTIACSIERGGLTIVSLPPVAVIDGAAQVALPLESLSAGGYRLRASYDPGQVGDHGLLESSGCNTLIVRKAWATLSLEALTATYDGTPRPVSVVTHPEGLEGVSVSYGGASEPPTAAGRYPVVARLDHPCYRAAPASGILVITPQEPQTIPSSPLNSESEDSGGAQPAADDRTDASPPAVEVPPVTVDVMPTQATAELLVEESDPPTTESEIPQLSPEPAALAELPTHLDPPKFEAVEEAPPLTPPDPPKSKPVEEPSQPTKRDDPERLDYLPALWGSIRCDQGSFIGGLSFESRAARESGPPEPSASDEPPPQVERRTTVVRGVVPNRRRSSWPGAENNAKRATHPKGLFKRIFGS